MNGLSIQANQNLSHRHGTWTSNVYDTSGTRTDNTAIAYGSAALVDSHTLSGLTGFVTCSSGGGSGYKLDTSSSGGSKSLFFNHAHDMQHIHSITSDGGNESRPDNYSMIIWKRKS